MSGPTGRAAKRTLVEGFCDSKFERLRDAFQNNFDKLGELGASYAVIAEGEVVLDLWGGWKDEYKTDPWRDDTIVGVWSASKGVGAVAFAMLVDRGLASYDDKVCKYWPEFGVNGKQDVTIGMLLSHQAGISGFDTPATLADFLAGEPAARRLAAQAPLWKIGTASGYGNVVGILATALFERIEGRSIRRFVAEELDKARGMDVSVGLAPENLSRLAKLSAEKGFNSLDVIPPANPAQRALHNPPVPADLPNRREFQAADIVAANGYANGRSLAAIYARMLGDTAQGRRLVGPKAFDEATRVRFDGPDIVRGTNRRWAAGFLLNTDNIWGPNKESFGHGGWGGSFGFADPVAQVAMGYAMNRMSAEMDANPRRRALIDALYGN